jgi:hypothetical protein
VRRVVANLRSVTDANEQVGGIADLAERAAYPRRLGRPEPACIAAGEQGDGAPGGVLGPYSGASLALGGRCRSTESRSMRLRATLVRAPESASRRACLVETCSVAAVSSRVRTWIRPRARSMSSGYRPKISLWRRPSPARARARAIQPAAAPGVDHGLRREGRGPETHQGCTSCTRQVFAPTDDEVPTGTHPLRQHGVGGLAHYAQLGEPPEQILAEDPLGQLQHRCADRQVYLMLDGQFVSDLQSTVARTHHDDGTSGDLTRVVLVGAVQLDHLPVQRVGEGGGNCGVLEWAGGNDHLTCSERVLSGVDCEPATDVLEPVDGRVEQHGQIEASCVKGEIVGNLVLGRIGVRWCGEVHARQARRTGRARTDAGSPIGCASCRRAQRHGPG